MTANREAPRLLGLAPATANGVSESARESNDTNQSGDAAAFDETRAPRT